MSNLSGNDRDNDRINYRDNLSSDLKTFFGKDFKLPDNFFYSEKVTENGESSFILETIILKKKELDYLKDEQIDLKKLQNITNPPFIIDLNK